MTFADQPNLRRAVLAVLPALGALAAILIAGRPAEASFILRLTDLGSGEQQIVIDGALQGALSDGGVQSTAADMADATQGAVLYVGHLGSFYVSVSGVGKPITGNPDKHRIDLVSLVISGGEGRLSIELTDTDFAFTRGDGTAHLTSNLGGTTDGTVTAQSYADLSNQEFAAGITPGEQGSFESLNGYAQDKSFSSSAATTFPIQPRQRFSFTQRVTVEHAGQGAGQSTSFDLATEAHAPEPSTWAMCVIAATCIGFCCRRRRRCR